MSFGISFHINYATKPTLADPKEKTQTKPRHKHQKSRQGCLKTWKHLQEATVLFGDCFCHSENLHLLKVVWNIKCVVYVYRCTIDR